MRQVMVRSTVKPDRVGEVAAFARFQAGVRERCDVAPVVTELREVGSCRP